MWSWMALVFDVMPGETGVAFSADSGVGKVWSRCMRIMGSET